VADEASLWACSSEGQSYPGSGFDDAGAELQKAQSQGGKLGGGERMRFGDCVSDGEDQPVRGGMQDQADLVGERAAAAGTIRGELSLVQLDQVLGLAAGAIKRLVRERKRIGRGRPGSGKEAGCSHVTLTYKR
jgi:hypothetical protein